MPNVFYETIFLIWGMMKIIIKQSDTNNHFTFDLNPVALDLQRQIVTMARQQFALFIKIVVIFLINCYPHL
jgi:hypothetical protein